MKNHFDYKIIGQTLDDAAGEAFDKVARILKLGYPGGPKIAKLANQKKKTNFGINLPRPMIKSPDLNFSFSGLKTAVLYLVKKNRQKMKQLSFIQSLCYNFQQAIIEVLIAKTLKAAQKYHPKTVILAGGVSANLKLRSQLGQALREQGIKCKYLIPDVRYAIDNAAMIATAGYYRWKNFSFREKNNCINNWKKIIPDANQELK
jgi:N6-L-threonylcarbamoyladenine synthase